MQDNSKPCPNGNIKLPKRSGIFALEVCFLAFVAVLVIAAFLEAFTYQLVSSRTPFVIMVPLLLLIVAQAVKLYRSRAGHETVNQIKNALAGRSPVFRKIVNLHAWFLGFFLLINLAGHYIALAVFVFMLIWVAAKERLNVAIGLSLGTTAVIFLLFAYGFNIELYPGLVYRYFAGYRIF